MRIKDIMPWSHHTGESHHQPDKADARHSLKQDINALVDRFVEKVGSFELPWHDTEAKSDVVQADKAVEISIELPGMELEDIDLSISGDMLVVQGERKIERREEKQGYFLSERAYGQIYRAIPLPPGRISPTLCANGTRREPPGCPADWEADCTGVHQPMGILLDSAAAV